MGTKGDNTRQHICCVAKELFTKKGYKDVSMQNICDATGLSKGGLYRHFSNKAEILLELVGKKKNVDNDICEGKSAVETLDNLLQIYMSDMKNCKESLAFALYEYAATEDEHFLDSGNLADKDMWCRLVEYGIKTGEFNEVDPELVMDTFLYAYRGVMMWGRVLPFEEKTFDNIAKAVHILLIKDYGRK